MPDAQSSGNGSFKPEVYQPQIGGTKLKMLVYGPPGVGKTSLSATAQDCPLTSPALMCNVEGGLLAITHRNIDVVDYKSYSQLEELLWFLVREKHSYKTFILDSLSELQVANIETIVTKAVVDKASPKRVSRDDIWQEDYGTSTSQMRRIVRAFRDLPMHVIMTCHHSEAQVDGKASIHPALTAKLRASVVGYMDVVGYMWAAEQDDGTSMRKLLCQPTGAYTAKDRTPGGKLGKVIENPTIPVIMDLIAKKETKHGKDVAG